MPHPVVITSPKYVTKSEPLESTFQPASCPLQQENDKLVPSKKRTVYCTEVRFASFLFGGFTTMAVINLPGWILVKRTSVVLYMSFDRFLWAVESRD